MVAPTLFASAFEVDRHPRHSEQQKRGWLSADLAACTLVKGVDVYLRKMGQLANGRHLPDRHRSNMLLPARVFRVFEISRPSS